MLYAAYALVQPACQQVVTFVTFVIYVNNPDRQLPAVCVCVCLLPSTPAAVRAETVPNITQSPSSQPTSCKSSRIHCHLQLSVVTTPPSLSVRICPTRSDTVALIGAHSLGRCHTDRSGYKGPWTNAPTTFSNLYFQELLNNKW